MKTTRRVCVLGPRSSLLFSKARALGGFGLLALLLALPMSAHAKRPVWELGLAGVAIDQQAYPGSSARSRRQLLLPYGIYRGPLLRVSDGQIGLRAVQSARARIDVSASGSIGASAQKAPLRQGMPKLGTLIELGPRFVFWPWGKQAEPEFRFEVPLRAVFDVSNGFASRGFTLAPRLSLRFRAGVGARFRLSYGPVWGSRKYNALLYGVPSAFASTARPVFDAGTGIVSQRVSMGFSVPLGKSWSIGGFARYDDVAGSANRASPLIDARRGWSTGLTLAVRLFESKRRVTP